MGELIVVDRKTVKEGHDKLEKLMEKDPRWREESEKRKRFFEEERARRDAEFAAKKQGRQEQGGK